MPEAIPRPLIIGRAHEIELLDRMLQATQQGSGLCVLLSGEAGIGKSRLADEVSNRAIAANFLVVQGYCSEQDISFPYAPWIDALRTLLGPKSQPEINELSGAFAPELVKLLPEMSSQVAAGQPLTPLDPAAEKHRLFASFARFVASLAAIHPLLIILEDLHWSDEQSFELLHYIVRHITSTPILIIGTYRSEDNTPRLAYHLAELNRERQVQEILLTPLARPEVGQLVQAVLQTDKPLSSDWLDLLMPLTQGNPFFVEEITRSIVQAGAQPGQWDPFQIPRNIQHTVHRRVNGLHERTQQILSMASVIGERFDFILLQEISGENEQSLLVILKELAAAQLIVEKATDQFAFRHAITREVVYSSLMSHERKAMHHMIAETIERMAGPRTEAYLAPLAYHFYQAEDWQKAMDYSQSAGEKAQSLYASREAGAHFSHALEAARRLGRLIPLGSLRGRAQARSILGDFDGAREDFETIIELARRDRDKQNEWQALIDLGYAWQPHDLTKAGEIFQQALLLARTLDNGSILARSLNRLGSWYFFRSQPDEALLLHQEALKIFQNLADQGGIAETLQLMGTASYGNGDVIQGVAYYEQAIPILRQTDNRQGLVRALEFLSLRARSITEVLGEVILSQLASFSEQAYEIAHSFDWHEGEGEALSRAAICWGETGEYARALDLLQRAQTLGEEIDHRHLLTSVHLLLGDLYLDLLALDQARHQLEVAFALAQEVGALQLLKSTTPLLVSVCIQQNDLPRAQAVLGTLSLTGNIDEIGRVGTFERLCWSAQAEIELALRQPNRTLVIVDRLITSAKNIDRFGPHAIPWLSQLRAQALFAQDRFEEAAMELLGAQTTAQAQGAIPLLWRLHADLGQIYRKLSRRLDAEKEFSSSRFIIQGLAKNIPDSALRENFLHQALAKLPAEHTPTPRQAAKREYGGLTAREREIAALIADGKSNREIASELYISDKTVERHVANILSKLRFNSRTQIAAWVVRKRMAQ